MRFNSKSVAFGRHATFQLRYGWLTKGYQALKQNENVFSSEDATVTLGVGKNMVDAIRYWLQATKVIDGSTGIFKPTAIGKVVFEEDGFDPYLEDEATIWLLHWHLASNPELGTIFYWFFNRFHKPEFTDFDCANALFQFVADNVKQKLSLNTLKKEVALLSRMYVQTASGSKMPVEEALDSPLSTLNLITQHIDKRSYSSKKSERKELPVEILGYAISQLFEFFNFSEMPIELLLYGSEHVPAVGSVFRLTENALISKLEDFINLLPGRYVLRETAGINQLYLLEKIQPLECLEIYFSTVKN